MNRLLEIILLAWNPEILIWLVVSLAVFVFVMLAIVAPFCSKTNKDIMKEIKQQESAKLKKED